MIIGISDKALQPWLKDKKYITASDEAEAVAMAMGYWYAKKEKATVFMSADGFMNCLNFLTSWAIPEKIEMNFVISYGRTEKPHYIASELLPEIIKLLLKYDTETISYELVPKE